MLGHPTFHLFKNCNTSIKNQNYVTLPRIRRREIQAVVKINVINVLSAFHKSKRNTKSCRNTHLKKLF